jgi:hypothetical protein
MIEDGAIRKMIKEVPRKYASGNNYLNQLFLECQTHSWLYFCHGNTYSFY